MTRASPPELVIVCGRCLHASALGVRGWITAFSCAPAGVSKEKLGEAACCAVKRIILDERMAKAATRAGANLYEGFEVSGSNLIFDKLSGLWTVTSAEVRCSYKGKI